MKKFVDDIFRKKLTIKEIIFITFIAIIFCFLILFFINENFNSKLNLSPQQQGSGSDSKREPVTGGDNTGGSNNDLPTCEEKCDDEVDSDGDECDDAFTEGHDLIEILIDECLQPYSYALEGCLASASTPFQKSECLNQFRSDEAFCINVYEGQTRKINRISELCDHRVYEEWSDCLDSCE